MGDIFIDIFIVWYVVYIMCSRNGHIHRLTRWLHRRSGFCTSWGMFCNAITLGKVVYCHIIFNDNTRATFNVSQYWYKNLQTNTCETANKLLGNICRLEYIRESIEYYIKHYSRIDRDLTKKIKQVKLVYHSYDPIVENSTGHIVARHWSEQERKNVEKAVNDSKQAMKKTLVPIKAVPLCSVDEQKKIQYRANQMIKEWLK